MLMVDEQVDDGFPKVDGKKVDEGMIIHIYIYVYIYISSNCSFKTGKTMVWKMLW